METALAAAKLGIVEQLEQALDAHALALSARDAEGRTPLHWSAGFGHERCVDLLLARPGVDPAPADAEGDSPLHFAAVHGQPMVAYSLAMKRPSMCLAANTRGRTPVDAAVACEQGEVLNAMLLACAGDGGDVAVAAMRALLDAGAVADTWAPNGSSALMLAASVDCVAAVEDALGRSALMFAAGNDARAALAALLGAGASIAARDRRGRSVLEYAAEHAAAHSLLQDRLGELEARAAEHRAALLADLEAEAAAPAKPKLGKKGKKAGKRVRKGAPGAGAGPGEGEAQEGPTGAGDEDEPEDAAAPAPECSLDTQDPAEQAPPSGSPDRPASPAPAERAPAPAPRAAAPDAASAPATPAQAGEVCALEAERAERGRERATAQGERRQLAALLQEAAQREALAVAAAVQRERLHLCVRGGLRPAPPLCTSTPEC
ncbi:hypothetical protein WJX81_001373 [Elliptochloris bilobata]|uniref:Uncharacterized protein n=1 Tax=Elliptochloris bilobata TaxID=381761 RepID=A0AAW1SJU0_9CHLO